MVENEIATQLVSSILKLRTRTGVKDPRTGLVAAPEFPEFRQSTIEHLLTIGVSQEDILHRLCLPLSWTCAGRTAPTAAGAIVNAIKAQQFQQAEAIQARVLAEAHGLPGLLGTIKQVQWANNIRAAHARKEPKSKQLFLQKRAAWWIENERAL